MFKPNIFALVGLFVGNVDRRDLARGLHDQFVGLDLYFARRQIGVDRVCRAQLDLASDSDNALEVGLLDKAEKAAAGVHHNLRKAIVVAKIYEKYSAMIA